MSCRYNIQSSWFSREVTQTCVIKPETALDSLKAHSLSPWQAKGVHTLYCELQLWKHKILKKHTQHWILIALFASGLEWLTPRGRVTSWFSGPWSCCISYAFLKRKLHVVFFLFPVVWILMATAQCFALKIVFVLFIVSPTLPPFA